MFEKIKVALMLGIAGMVVSIPFLAIFGSIYHYTEFFKAMKLEWNIVVLYSGACGGAAVAVWWTKKEIWQQLFNGTKEETLKNLLK